MTRGKAIWHYLIAMTVMVMLGAGVFSLGTPNKTTESLSAVAQPPAAPRSLKDVSSMITKVERPGIGGPGPFSIVYMVTNKGVLGTFVQVEKAMDWWMVHGDHNYQQFIFRIAVPAVDNYGQKFVSPAMEIRFAKDRQQLQRMDWSQVTPVDILKFSDAVHITQPGFEWGHDFCGDDIKTAHEIPFCGAFVDRTGPDGD